MINVIKLNVTLYKNKNKKKQLDNMDSKKKKYNFFRVVLTPFNTSANPGYLFKIVINSNDLKLLSLTVVIGRCLDT